MAKAAVEVGTRFVSAYDRRLDPVIDCAAAEADGDLSQTVQAEKDNCDINVIIARFQKTGILPDIKGRVASVFGDISNVPDFHEAQTIVAKAGQLFMELPADVRSRFSNDPGQFLSFVGDPKNADALVEMGLATKPVSVPVAPVNDATTSERPQGAGVDVVAGA